ncbi:MAG TPA: hypothetical protein VGD41_14970, partial [Pyrinomonadaceae bacterium]
MSKWAWGGAGDQVVTITPEAVATHDQKPAVKTQRAKTSPLFRVLPIASVVLSAAVIGLLVYFFKQDPARLPGQLMMNRFANIGIMAVLLAALGVIVGASVFYLARLKNSDLAPSSRVLGVVSIILAIGVFGTAV